MLVLAAGRPVGWPSHVADDLQAKPAALPEPSSILAVPSFFAFQLLACATFGHGCARPAGLESRHVPQPVPMWTALLEVNSAQSNQGPSDALPIEL